MIVGVLFSVIMVAVGVVVAGIGAIAIYRELRSRSSRRVNYLLVTSAFVGLLAGLAFTWFGVGMVVGPDEQTCCMSD